MPTKSKPPSAKKQVSATNKLIRESQQQAKRDLVDRWRFLQKIGAYHSKEAAAQSRLTKSRIAAIEKKFREIQKQRKYIKGRTVRPIEYSARKTRGGKTVYDYHISPHFEFVKTKFKPTALEGVQKVGKGYIVEKSNTAAKIKVNKRGDIIETIGKQQRVRRRYRGRDLLKLIDQFDRGTYKFKKHDFFVLHKWGSPNEVISAPEDGVSLLSNYVKELQRTMTPDTFDKFASASYIEIIKFIED